MKVIWFANINSEFTKLNEQLTKLCSKNGAFDIVILSGKVFNDLKGLDGLKKYAFNFTSSLFIILDTSAIGTIIKHSKCKSEEVKADEDDIVNSERSLQIGKNILIFKNSGVINIQGLNIGFLQGYEYQGLTTDRIEANKFNRKIYFSNYFRKEDYINLLQYKDKHIDILLTNSLPHLTYQEIVLSGYIESKELKVDNLISKSSFLLNSLINLLSPRYLLIATGEDFYFERPPFLKEINLKDEKAYTLTRVIHLSNFNGSVKQNPKEKFIYALNIEPAYDNNHMLNSKILLDQNEVSNYKPNPFSSFEVFEFDNKQGSTDCNEVYIGNIHTSVNQDKLYDFLIQFGDIEKLIYPCKEKNHQGYAFVEFRDRKVHNSIISLSNKYSLRGRKIIFDEKINPSTSAKPQSCEALSCWFCYENPKIDTNLIINSSFEYFYIAFPKGAINQQHFLIIPKKHLFSSKDFNFEQKKEISLILTKLTYYIKSFTCSKDVIVYERLLPYKDDLFKHMIINVIGIEDEFHIKAFEFFNDKIMKKQDNYKKQLIKGSISLSEDFLQIDCLNDTDFFYHILFPSGLLTNIYYKIVLSIPRSQVDNTDMIRPLICKLINKEENSNWKKSSVLPDDLDKLKKELNRLFVN